MVRESAYEPVMDSQRHYRAILDSFARPGKINRLHAVAIDPPPGLNTATVFFAFALLDADTTFAVIDLGDYAGTYFAASTHAPQAATENAAFLFLNGTEQPEALEGAHCGTLLYPDTAATVVIQIELASMESFSGSVRLTFEGPGVDGTATLFLGGLNPNLLLALQARNSEYPLGLDAMFTWQDASATPCVVGLPRSNKFSWEQL